MSSVIVVEERLRTTGLSVTLWLVTVVMLAVEVTVLAVAGSPGKQWVPIAIVAVVTVGLMGVSVATSRIVVRVLESSTGRILEVLYGPGPLLRQVFTPEEILAARAQSVTALSVGGWGYRGSLRFMKYAVLITRRGDALELTLSGGRRFVVTVDEPEAFASALTASTGSEGVRP